MPMRRSSATVSGPAAGWSSLAFCAATHSEPPAWTSWHAKRHRTHVGTCRGIMVAGAASITLRNNETEQPCNAPCLSELMVCLNELLKPERSIGGAEFRCFAIPLSSLGRVALEIEDAEALQHDRIKGSPQSERGLGIIAFGCPA